MAAIYLFAAILGAKWGWWRWRAFKIEGRMHLGSVFRNVFKSNIGSCQGERAAFPASRLPCLAGWRWLPLTAYLFVWSVCRWVFQFAGQSVWLHFFRVCCKSLFCFCSLHVASFSFHFVHYWVVCFTLFVNILFSAAFVYFFSVRYCL